MSQPDWDGCIEQQWGWPTEVSCAFWGAASNIAIGTNPAYAFNDFLSIYPKFFGPAAQVTGDLANGSAVVNNVSSFTGVSKGQLVAGTGVPSGTTIVSFDSVAKTITLSQNATATVTGSSFSIYTAPPMPLAVISAFIALAAASVQQVRWFEMWTLAMAMFIAHYCTLYLRSEGNPGSTAGQLAMSGLERGIQVSKSVGPVSVSNQLLDGYEDFGSFRETTYGTQFITMAKSVGSGPVLIW